MSFQHSFHQLLLILVRSLRIHGNSKSTWLFFLKKRKKTTTNKKNSSQTISSTIRTYNKRIKEMVAPSRQLSHPHEKWYRHGRGEMKTGKIKKKKSHRVNTFLHNSHSDFSWFDNNIGWVLDITNVSAVVPELHVWYTDRSIFLVKVSSPSDPVFKW